MYRDKKTDLITTLPLVCICIPNYNNEATISETIDSLLNQTYSNIIVKVFDNASTDRSLEILYSYKQKYSNIQIFQSEQNIGAEANFSRCIEHMEGEYSAIFHSDDVYESTIVEKEVETLERLPISAVFTSALLIDGKGQSLGKLIVRDELKSHELLQISYIKLLKYNLKYGNVLVCPSAMSRTSTYKEVIRTWDASKYKTATDVDIWLRFAKWAPIGLLPEPLIRYRVSSNSFSFRRLKTRVEALDIFTVLDDHIKEPDTIPKLMDSDYLNYKFLKFRDTVVIEKNCIFNGIKQKNTFNVLDLEIIKVAFQSRQSLFIYFVGMVFKVFNYNGILSKFFKASGILK